MKYLSRTNIQAVAVLLVTAPMAWAQTNELPSELEEVDVIQKVDQLVALDLGFADETGAPIRVSDYFNTLPVIITLNFSDCPQLCSVQLDTMTDALRDVDLTPGRDFRIITLSIDPNETHERASATKDRYVERYMRPEASEGWHFLTGTEENIRTFADSVGFKYNYIEEQDTYAHAPALIFVTPEGRIARYLSSVAYYQPTNLRYSLVEAGQGKIGSVIDQVFLSCFYYDPTENRYVLFATNLMKLGALLTVIALLVFWWRMRRFEATRNHPLPQGEAAH